MVAGEVQPVAGHGAHRAPSLSWGFPWDDGNVQRVAFRPAHNNTCALLSDATRSLRYQAGLLGTRLIELEFPVWQQRTEDLATDQLELICAKYAR